MCMKCSLPVRKHKILLTTFYKIAISRKTKFFGTSWLFFLDSMDLWQYPFKKNHRKTMSQIFVCKAKDLVITQGKEKEAKMVLSYFLQQNVGVELHMI